MFRLGLLALAALAACTDAVDVAQNTCGNYVYEPTNNEDCDSPGVGCTTACRVVCDPTVAATSCGTQEDGAPAVDGKCCPSGAACGLDAICHVPTGLLSSQATTEPFQVSSYVVSDLDGDGIADVLGVSTAGVQARYGSQGSPLAALISQTTPFATGAPALGDYDGDGKPDVVVPIAAGIFAFNSVSGAPEPVAFPKSITTAAQHLRVGADGAYEIRLDAEADGLHAIETQYPYGGGTTSVIADEAPCGAAGTTALYGRGLHVYDDGTRRIVPISLVDPNDTDANRAFDVCVWIPGDTSLELQVPKTFANPGVTGPLGTTTTVTYTLTLPAAAAGETFIGDAIGAGSQCPDVVAPVTITNIKKVVVVTAPPSTTTTNTPGVLPGAFIVRGKYNSGTSKCDMDPTNELVAPIGIPLAVATLASQAAIITETGVWSMSPALCGLANTPCLASPSPRPWLYAVAQDFDGDGLTDLATASTSQDVEVLHQDPVSGSALQWVDRRIETTGTVYEIGAGDFDGDSFVDLAITTIDQNNDRTGDIVISYGDSGGQFGVATPVLSLPELNDLVVAQVPDLSLPPGFDHYADLIVASGGDNGGNNYMTVIYGSGIRQPTAPYIIANDVSTTQSVAGVGALIGRYGDGGAPGIFAAFETPDLISGRLGLTAGTGGGSASTKDNAVFVGLSPSDRSFDATSSPDYNLCGSGSGSGVDNGSGSSDDGFCGHSATYFSVPLTDGDVMLALQYWDSMYCGAFYRAGMSPGVTNALCSDLVPSSQGSAANPAPSWFTNVTRAQVIAGANTETARVEVFATSAKVAYDLYLFDLTWSSTGPVLGNPLAVSTDIKNATNVTSHCMDAVAIDLGTRTINGTTFGGTGQDLAIACSSTVGTKTTTKIFARFANPTPGGTPFVIQLIDTGINSFVDLEAGDVNGDGLPDLLYTAGASEGAIFVHLQCDTHQTCTLGV